MDNNQQPAAVDVTPDTPGSILRRCREFQNMTIEDASEATKIGRNYLRALESDRAQDFPNQAYLKGFLKIYATHLGLKAEDLLRMLELPAATADESQAIRAEERIEVRRRLWQRLLLPAALLAAIAVAALFFMPQQQAQVRTSSPVPPPAAVVQQPRSSSTPTPPQQPDTLTPAAATAATPAPPPLPARQNGLVVRLKALKNGQLTITIDESTSQPYELTSGDLIEWKADRVIALELSDGSGVELELNGKPFKPTVQAGKPASLVLDSSGVIRQP